VGREIKFRGMDINGRWFHGLLSISQGKSNQPKAGHYISNSAGSPWAYQVRPETVGQFTGLNDKIGREIYEGDIVRIYDSGTAATATIAFGDFGCFSLLGYLGDLREHAIKDFLFRGCKLEVIGNVHENHGLLEVTDDVASE